MTPWQAEDRDTVPDTSSNGRKPAQGASRTIKIATDEMSVDAKTSAGNALFKNHTTVVFALSESDVVLPIHVKDRIVIGRLDMDSTEVVDIDLLPYGARANGVSRRHAALYRTRHTVSLVDLNSSNGTYLNGVKLIPLQPRLLREEDEVRLGNMRFHVHFDR